MRLSSLYLVNLVFTQTCIYMNDEPIYSCYGTRETSWLGTRDSCQLDTKTTRVKVVEE